MIIILKALCKGKIRHAIENKLVTLPIDNSLHDPMSIIAIKSCAIPITFKIIRLIMSGLQSQA